MDSTSEDEHRAASVRSGPENSSGEEEGKGPIGSFLATYERRRTREAYGHDLRDFFGAKEITPKQAEDQGESAVQEYLEEVEEEAGPKAAGRRGAALRAFYRWAWKKGHLPKEKAEDLIEATRD